MTEQHLFQTPSRVTPDQRVRLLGQRGAVVWFTGLSGSGKSTLAKGLECALVEQGHLAYLLDGDNLRHGLCRDLDFSPEGRAENVRRVSEVSSLLADAGLICITALISPLREAREAARQVIGPARFFEIHVSTPLAVCEQRDCKGLYARARAGTLAQFTGVSAPYEPPERPALDVDTSVLPLGEALERLVGLLRRDGFIGGSDPGRPPVAPPRGDVS
jgi:adenylylsulfate kinase